ATVEARRMLDRFRPLVATTSPLSDDQSAALLSTLVAELKRWDVDDRFDRFRPFPIDPRMQLEYEEERIRAREESNRRIVESARSSLDARQLTVLQDSLAQYITKAQAVLQSRRERLESGVR